MKPSKWIMMGLGASVIASTVLVRGVSASDSKTRACAHLVVIETGTATRIIDVPAAPADGQAGDIGIFESTLSTKDGKQVGTLVGHCIVINPDDTLDDCDVTVTIGASSYRMSGPFDPAKGGTLAITGGTGDWVGAAGTDTIVNQPDGTAIHTIDLLPR